MEEHFLVEVKIMQYKKSYLLFSGLQPIAYSRLFIFEKRATVRDIKKKLFSFFRPMIKAPEFGKKGKKFASEE